ncbi:Hypothetical predicted protein [Pelobates cultripes]|uniref:Uncharacterized protein n=1 Tax=Pelobates cultripes TaxID=61616 RepID=A0AAD1WWA0_PELCU|nr:Hypothetical predicted protein [Pelobates cultripes]
MKGRKSLKPVPAATALRHSISQMLSSTPCSQGTLPHRPETTPSMVGDKGPTDEARAAPGAETPVAKEDIHDLLAHFQDMFFAEINLVKTELQAVTECLRASEKDTADLRQGMTTQGESSGIGCAPS